MRTAELQIYPDAFKEKPRKYQKQMKPNHYRIAFQNAHPQIQQIGHFYWGESWEIKILREYKTPNSAQTAKEQV